jgi:hypothetical protein
MTSETILQTLLVSAIILALLTPAALWWPWDELPHRRGALVVLEDAGFRPGGRDHRGDFLPRLGTADVPQSHAGCGGHRAYELHLRAHTSHRDTRIPISLTVFFPGLVMGTLREKYGNVLPGMIFHFIGNIWAIWFFPAPINFLRRTFYASFQKNFRCGCRGNFRSFRRIRVRC